MNTNIIFIVCGLVFGILLIPTTIGSYQATKVYTEGKLVNVVVTDVPNNWLSKSRGALRFDYEGSNRFIMVSGQVNDVFHFGDTIQLIYSKEYDRFRLPHDNPIWWGVACFILFLGGVVGCIYYLIYPPKY